MRRIAFAALVAALILTTGLAYSGHAEIGTAISEHRTSDLQRQEIRYQRVDRPKWTTHEVVKTIRAAVRRWPVPGGASKALSVAYCESHYDERAYNPNGHGGVYQQDTGAWPGRQDAFGRPRHRWHLGENWRNARSNIVVSIRMAHAGGWSGWSCA